MKVKLLSHTPDPEKLVAAAAKNCYSASNVDNILEGLTEEKTESFVNMLSEIGHESPIEHVSFTFAIEGVSRSLLAQITRHRMASFSVQSQRYVREKGFEYVVPPEIDKIPAAREKFIQAMEDDQRTYEELTAALMEGYLKEPKKCTSWSMPLRRRCSATAARPVWTASAPRAKCPAARPPRFVRTISRSAGPNPNRKKGFLCFRFVK